MNQRLIHDTAYALALHLLGMVEPCLRPEEQREFFSMAYEAAKASLEAFCIQMDRQTIRLCRIQTEN